MASARGGEQRGGGPGWLSMGLGVVVLTIGGFALGLVVGVVSEEPELVAGHVAGRSTEIDWGGRDAEAPAARADDEAWRAGEPAAPRTASRRSLDEPAGKRPRPREAAPEEEAALPQVAAPPPAEPRAATDASLRFAVQVGAFGSEPAATGVARELREAGYPVRVVAPESDDRWRVRVGPLASRAEAEHMARRLKLEESLPTWVLQESGR